jgi:hypothetical protein
MSTVSILREVSLSSASGGGGGRGWGLDEVHGRDETIVQRRKPFLDKTREMPVRVPRPQRLHSPDDNDGGSQNRKDTDCNERERRRRDNGNQSMSRQREGDNCRERQRDSDDRARHLERAVSRTHAFEQTPDGFVLRFHRSGRARGNDAFRK